MRQNAKRSKKKSGIQWNANGEVTKADRKSLSGR